MSQIAVIIAKLKSLSRQLKERIEAILRLLILPGFDEVPLYDVLVFFGKGIFKGALTIRAAAVAFNFFLAIFPFILFIFTLIPYIPIESFQETLMGLFEDIIPPNTFNEVEETITEIVMRQNTGLLSLSFILTFIFSTNGISAIMDGFNGTWHGIDTKNWLQQRLSAVFLLVVLSFFVVLAIALITTGGVLIKSLIASGWIDGGFTAQLLQISRWFVIVFLTFFSLSMLYYYAPAKRKDYRFISPGSILATALFIVGTLAFNFYISNFSRYNALYGSIGTLIIFMMWLYFNALILLIGFELNASILQAKKENLKLEDVE
ncbi:MAG TPA: YihY/virulence factor BrkB family protein [Bacteroidales bacterium]|jgi:membrane protein|nr:YihY/virulence factor BrkB family protein [Bacteroidales bacterium]MDY0084757.1 YihY/virulence factor BrkB family protein [Bacteroidales bacterium]HPE44089.1 YihY/virulence factor BrkB family protein [Bacteroidales bacterium]